MLPAMVFCAAETASGCFWLKAEPEGRSVLRAEAAGWSVLTRREAPC